MNSSFALSEYQAGLRGLMNELGRVFDSAGIPYFALFGTCLGALRHKGMIPWDDDIDIGMLRADYDRAMKLIREKCPSLYVWDWDHDNKCNIQISRVFRRLTSEQTFVNKKVFIDVFPVDNAPKSALMRKMKAVFSIALRRLVLRKNKTALPYRRNAVSNYLLALIALPFFWLSTRRLRQIYNWIILNKKTGLIWFPTDHANCSFPLDWFSSVRVLPFDDIRMPVPANAEKYLEGFYGDWRIPPLGSEQNGHTFDSNGLDLMLGPDDALRLG